MLSGSTATQCGQLTVQSIHSPMDGWIVPRLKDLNKTREKSERGIIELVLDKGKLLFKRQSGLALLTRASS